MNSSPDKSHRPATPAENLLTIRARLWDHLSVAERRELSDAANILKPANTDEAPPSAKNAPLMEIAHIVMGWQNEDEHTHVRMLYEIEELIARSDGTTKEVK